VDVFDRGLTVRQSSSSDRSWFDRPLADCEAWWGCDRLDYQWTVQSAGGAGGGGSAAQWLYIARRPHLSIRRDARVVMEPTQTPLASTKWPRCFLNHWLIATPLLAVSMSITFIDQTSQTWITQQLRSFPTAC